MKNFLENSKGPRAPSMNVQNLLELGMVSSGLPGSALGESTSFPPTPLFLSTSYNMNN